MKLLVRKYILVNSSMAFIFGLKMPVFFLMLLDKGFSLFQIGTLVTITTVSAIACEIPFGTLADNIGRKKVFILGEFAALVSVLGFLLSAQFEWVALFMLMDGMSKALVSGSLDALFVEQYNEVNQSENRADFMKLQSKILASSAIGLGMSTILAGFVPIWFKQFSTHIDWINFYDLNFIIMAVLTAAHMILTAVVIKESKKSVGSHHKANRKTGQFQIIQFLNQAIASVKGSPLVIALFAITFVNGLAFTSLTNLWQPRLSELIDSKGDTWMFGLLSSLSFFAMAAGQRLSSKVSDWFNNHYGSMLLATQIALTLFFVSLAQVTNIISFFLLYAFIMMMSGISMSPLLTMLHRYIEEKHRSTILSVKSVFQQAGATCGALAGGWIADRYGIFWAWCVVAATLFISAFIYLLPAIKQASTELAIEKRSISTSKN